VEEQYSRIPNVAMRLFQSLVRYQVLFFEIERRTAVHYVQGYQVLFVPL